MNTHVYLVSFLKYFLILIIHVNRSNVLCFNHTFIVVIRTYDRCLLIFYFYTVNIIIVFLVCVPKTCDFLFFLTTLFNSFDLFTCERRSLRGMVLDPSSMYLHMYTFFKNWIFLKT